MSAVDGTMPLKELNSAKPRLWLSVVAEEVASVAGRGGDGSEGGGEMVVFGCGVAAAGNGCGGGGDEGGYGGCCGEGGGGEMVMMASGDA
ncbi:hypothetical protein Tco_1032707 [Tanacetum coccineum]|uniref:Uncharacterized protein n=1 Tax=Tanacetum coccineum TaxID=301880 RepID=A0ABQ5GE08_9ASTR